MSDTYVRMTHKGDKKMNVDYEIRTKIMNTLIECRKEKGISQKELAQLVDSKETTVASWEQGKSLPSIDMLYRLSQYYNKTMNYMCGDRDDCDLH